MKKGHIFILFLIIFITPLIILTADKSNDNPKDPNFSEEVSDPLPDFGNESLEKAITYHLLTQKDFSWQTTPGSKNFCVIKNLDPEKELFPLYVWARCSEYIIRDGRLKELSGSSIPVKIDYPNELSYYDIDKFSHEIPRDGSDYSKDIKGIFSDNAQESISSIQQRIADINNELELKALKWFSADNVVGADNLWEKAKLHLKNCNVEEVFQAHSQRVVLHLKNGEEMEAFEPQIDDIIEVAQNPKIIEKCGRITIATE